MKLSKVILSRSESISLDNSGATQSFTIMGASAFMMKFAKAFSDKTLEISPNYPSIYLACGDGGLVETLQGGLNDVEGLVVEVMP